MLRILLLFALSSGLLGGTMLAAEGEDAAPLREEELGEVTLAIPSDWKTEKPDNNLRLGQFVIPAVEGDERPAELTVFQFGNSSVQDNIDRWIGQFAPTERQATVYKGKSRYGAYYLVDVQGTYNESIGPPVLRRTRPVPNSRMLAVLLQLDKQGQYYLKLTGPRKTVAEAADPLRAAFGADTKSEEIVPQDE